MLLYKSGSRHAEEFIDKLIGLDAKRRGLSGANGKQTRQHKQGAATLNLSGGHQQAPYLSPTADRFNQVTPFYDSLVDKPMMTNARNTSAILNSQEGLAGL